MNCWSSKSLIYPTEEDAFLSADAMKILEKLSQKKRKERNYALYSIGFGMM
jgi:hypothetical protein